jgi:hypothetical protein
MPDDFKGAVFCKICEWGITILGKTTYKLYFSVNALCVYEEYAKRRKKYLNFAYFD